MHKRTKKILTTIIVVFALIILALIGGGTYMLNYSLCPQNRGKNNQGSYDYMFEKYPYRSEERRVGKECTSCCRPRCAQAH